jgi:hypothetical protein
MITWSGLGLGRAYAINIAYLTGVSTLSGSATANAWMGNNAISVAGRTRAANTIIIGALIANDFKWSIARGGTVYRDNPANIHYEFFTKPVSSAGMVDPGGTGPIGSTYSGVWAAFSGTCDPAGKC